MDIQNHYYGHSSALANYCGMSEIRHIPGLLQHGWTVKSPVLAQFADFNDRGSNRKRLIWTSASRGFAMDGRENRFSDGSSMVTAVGAPFLYLLQAARDGVAVPKRTTGTVVLPVHGTALMKVSGDHEGFAEEVLRREGPSAVCLHIEDLAHPEIYRAWTDAGHEVISAGERRNPQFLGRILWMMGSAQKVVSNRMSTALLYAAAAGAAVQIYGPDFQLGENAETDPGLRMRELWPEFYEKSPDSAELKRIADMELGVQDMKSPDELKDLLGWNSRSVGAFWDYWASGPLEKAQAVLGLRKRPEGAHSGEAGLSPIHFLRHPLKHLPSPLPKLTPAVAVEPVRLKESGRL
ncbi:hypothetical protein [Arthrobacter globiformis]|uniref:hypothetical protein n=1 Tax=Arthrobacter globiformis TaxID=1665 RepID=UPI00279215C7|nr:hypothetical protein [Arthrobacter globiformis]MDQ0619539.1 hypothetical protein [Arthrobacter globiformis]